MENKHTPGPWKFGYDNKRYFILNLENDILATIRGSITKEKEDKANAQLIARAPELLLENNELKKENERLKKKLEEYIEWANHS